MTDWSAKHRGMMEHITRAIDEADAPLTEIQLWNLIARTYSPEWATARAQLQDAEQQINIHKSPENRALGAIGAALESSTINKDEEIHAATLATFTILDEELRRNPELNRLLKILHGHSQMLEESLRLSRGVADATAEFAAVASPDSVRVEYTPLQKAFRRAKKLLKRTSSSAKVPNGPRQKGT